jgi:ribosomal RNA assembly protein
MKIIPSDDSSKVIESKKKLEEYLKVKITVKEKEISIDGNPEDEFIAEKVLDAIVFGFSIPIALSIQREDFIFEILNIKNYTHRNDLERIRARIIGSGGKTLKTLNELTECNFAMKNNEVGIIGSPELIKNAGDAVISIIRGSKQANVYSFLEKHHVKPILDLGLKEPKKKKSIKKKV